MMVGGDTAGGELDDVGGAAADAEFGRKPETESVVWLCKVSDDELELEMVVTEFEVSGVDVALETEVRPSSL